MSRRCENKPNLTSNETVLTTFTVHQRQEKAASETYLNWNTHLRSALDSFTKSHPDATVLLFSSFEVFNHILDEYEAYGFKAKEIRQAFGAVWNDFLHPTSKIHDILAAHFADFLRSVSLPASARRS